MPEYLNVSQIGSSPLPPPFRGLHSPGVRKHCQIIFACYFQKSSIDAYNYKQRILQRLNVNYFCIGIKHCEEWMLLFLHGCLIPGKYMVNLFCRGLEAGEELSLLLLNAQSGADSQRPSLSNILGNPGKPDHMINDVIECTVWCRFTTTQFEQHSGKPRETRSHDQWCYWMHSLVQIHNDPVWATFWETQGNQITWSMMLWMHSLVQIHNDPVWATFWETQGNQTTWSMMLLNAQSGADSQRPSLSNILGNPGKPDHMINDVIECTVWCRFTTTQFEQHSGKPRETRPHDQWCYWMHSLVQIHNDPVWATFWETQGNQITWSMMLLNAQSGADSQRPSLSNILGNPGKPDHMINDVIECTVWCRFTTTQFEQHSGKPRETRSHDQWCYWMHSLVQIHNDPVWATFWETQGNQITWSMMLLNAQSGADSQRPSLSNILGNPGKPDHMINDVIGWCRSLHANSSVFVAFWSSKSKQNCQVFSVFWISAPRWWHGTSVQMKWFILLWIFRVMELKTTKRICLERRGMLKLTQPVSVVTVTIQKKEWRKGMNSVYGGCVCVCVGGGGWWGGHGRKKGYDVVVVEVVGGEEGFRNSSLSRGTVSHQGFYFSCNTFVKCKFWMLAWYLFCKCLLCHETNFSGNLFLNVMCL